jgi:uncharacterized membrane protein YagU involved in acid resistance
MANLLRGMAAGLLAGCAASYLMNQLPQTPPRQKKPSSSEKTAEIRGQSERRQAREGGKEEQDTTVATAQAISRKLFHHELSDGEKMIAGPAVHYAYGSIIGAMYGGMAEVLPIVGAGFGLPFGFTLWLLGDEIAVPALGLAKGPADYPAAVHADALASHFLYGFSTDLMRRVLRHVL